MWLSGNRYFDLYYLETPYKLTYKNFKLIDTMKTTRIMIMVAAAVAAIACNKENVEPTNPEPAPSDGIVTFTAGFDVLGEPATRTNLAQDGAGKYTKMEWSKGDVIGVVDKNGEIQPFTTEAGGATAIFKGTAEAPESTWYAFYPYNKQASVKSATESSFTDPDLRISIPEVQFAKKDGVSDNVTTLVGNCSVEKNSINFIHVCGFVQINAPEGCVSVTIELPDANDGITGGVATKFYTYGTYSTQTRYRSVTLVSQEGMATGNYYIAVKPINYTGKVRITMHHKDGSVFVKEASGLSVGAGQVLPVNITGFSWAKDKEISLFTGADEDRFPNYDNGYQCKIAKVSDETMVGIKSMSWAFTEEISSQWAGYLNLYGNAVDLTDYQNDYALEYYIKCNQAAVTTCGVDWQFIQHVYNGDKADREYIIMSRRYPHDTYFGLADTGWHRISLPIKDVISAIGEAKMSKFSLKPFGNSVAAIQSYKGAEFYINNLRIVRITPTEKE